MSAEPSDEEDREVISILERRDGVATEVILRDGTRCLAYDIFYAYDDDGEAVAHVTTNISPGEPGRAIDFFYTSEVGAIRDAASGEALFIAAGWPLPERDASWLLGDLCVKFGICPLDDHDRLLERPPVTVDEFTDAVIRADGMDPVLMERWFRALVRECVAAAFAKANPPRRRSRLALSDA